MKHSQTIAAASLAAACIASLTAAAPADAHGGGRQVLHSGACSGAADWKLKVKADDGRLEVEGEVDGARVGRRWTWRLVHDGSVAAHGRRTVQAPSGSFEVRRLLGNRAGKDTVTFRARSIRTGQVCRGTVRF
jgi:hypothetical protein